VSTAVDTAFEEITAEQEDAGEPAHGVCAVCYPTTVPVGGVAFCGYRFPEEEPVVDCPGLHKCGKCLGTSRPPCGH
jgi:hypothetical protein